MLPTRVRRENALSPLDALQEDFGRLFGRMWSDASDYGAFGAYPVDIREDEDHIYIDAEMPGFRKDEIDITLENGLLTIQAERKPAEAKGTTHLNERRYTKVARRFTLPNTVDESKVNAQLGDGVLSLTLNKREEVKPRKIEVR